MKASIGFMIVAAGIGIALGMTLFQTFIDLKTESAAQMQENQELKIHIARLLQETRVQMNQPVLSGTLASGCREDECLMRVGDGHNGYVVGVGKFKGFYRIVQRSAWGETGDCDTLVLIGGTETLLNEYTKLIQQGNTVNSLDSQNRIQFNLDLAQTTRTEREKILNSTETTPIELVVLNPLPGGKGVSACYSFVEILKVK